jgi:hypothetical protein
MARWPAVLLLWLAIAPGVAWAQFTVPNEPTAAFHAQSRIFAQDVQILVAAYHGNGVQSGSGCVVTAQASPNMTVHVSACTIVREGSTVAVSAGDPAITAANSTNPRLDIISATNAGALIVTAGTPASSPLPPTIPQSGGVDNIVLAFVYVPAGATAIGSAQITDKRVPVNAPGGGGGAPTSATYITQTPDGTLSAEQALSALASGYAKVTTGTGVVSSQAVPIPA